MRATGVRVALLLDAEREVGVAARAFVAELSAEPEAAVAHPGASVVCAAAAHHPFSKYGCVRI